jgi:FkbM family methyltransferase
MILGIAQHVPSPLIHFAYKVPLFARISSKVLRNAAAVSQPMVVSIRQGPLMGWKLQIDSQTPHYYWIKGHDEPAVLQIMQKIIKPGHHVVDVGAHIGIETLMFSQWVGTNGHVVSIEPEPSNFNALFANVRLNALSNVKLMQSAISDTMGELKFVQGKGVLSHVADNLHGGDGESASLITVQAYTLDELFSGKQPLVDFIKIDVEDFEVAVLCGARQLLHKHQPIIMLELHSYRSTRGCADILVQAGYQLELVDVPEKDIEGYLATQPRGDFNHGFGRCHLLAKPSHD